MASRDPEHSPFGDDTYAKTHHDKSEHQIWHS